MVGLLFSFASIILVDTKSRVLRDFLVPQVYAANRAIRSACIIREGKMSAVLRDTHALMD